MAIDDSTSYELTGAQVKDLANKIKGKAADNTFVGATPAAPGSKGLVPEPQAGDNTKFLSGDGTWQTVSVDNYSTNEVNTGTTWINGKPIYKQTFTGAYNSPAKVTTNIFTFSGVSDLVDVKGWIADSDAKVAFGTTHRAGTSLIFDSTALLVDTNVIIRSFNNTEYAGSNLSYAVTLYYTKTTG